MKKHPNLYLIGLTGNIACGKSTVVSMLEELGAHAIDADQVTHQVQEPGTPTYQQIVDNFGEDILTAPGGPIDRQKLGALVFGDAAKLQRLEHIVHPAVHARIVVWLSKIGWNGESRRKITSDLPRHIAVIDAIKLLEAGWRYHCDAIWVVACSQAKQMERLTQTRGMRLDEANRRIASQPTQESRITQADVVIDASGTPEETRAQVEQAWEAIRAR